MEIIKNYFPDLSEIQYQQLAALLPLYEEWNQKINVISRKDITNLYERHILHSMAIAKMLSFQKGGTVLDLGTGGGLPGIPLAILFPDTQFTLVDGTRKKLIVVQEIVDALSLKNVEVKHGRAEEMKERFDFVVCRAVASLDKLLLWTKHLIKNKQIHAIPNGLLALKGGNLKNEIKSLPKGEYLETFALSDWYKEPYYEEKFVIYIQF